MLRLVLAPAILAIALSATATPAAAGDGSWAWPVSTDGPLTDDARFDAPDTPYAAGHRGIDLPTLAGAPVRSVAHGTVVFAGKVAGIDVVSIDHGTERSTYQPVVAEVAVGQRVAAADVIGQVGVGPFHCPTPCLHLGRIAQADDRYLDPLDRLAVRSHIRLVDPTGPPPVPPVGALGAGILRRPVSGPVTSTFGRRDHPVHGRESMHDGVDFGAACGAAVRAAGTGTVTQIGRSAAYGLRVVIRHGPGVETSYSHLAETDVGTGDPVTTGSIVGKVGSTGLSTGCHLHFGVQRDGHAVDPVRLL